MKDQTLYLVPTPIGNLADITYRAVEVLRLVDYIYAEDTRVSRVLLNHYQIKTPLKSYHQFNEKERCLEITNLLQQKKKIALISDAGTPGISDPSNIVVKHVIDKGFFVCALPGATALIPALVASGMDSKNFYMAGFLPPKKSEKAKLLNWLKNFEIPIIFYEAPHRLLKFFHEINHYLGNCEVCIAKEISKIHESYYHGKLNELINNLQIIILKGEFVIVVIPEKKIFTVDDEINHLLAQKYSHLPLSEASKKLAIELNISKNYVYQFLLKR